MIVAFPVNTLPVIAILHWHYGSDVIKPFIKRFPSGAFGVCMFDVVAFLCLDRLGLVLTVALAYAVDIAYVVLVAHLSRPRPPEDAFRCSQQAAEHLARSPRCLTRPQRVTTLAAP